MESDCAPRRPRLGAASWPTARVEYTLQACVALARSDVDARMKTREIADALGIPLRFLSNILLDLGAAGLVSAKRGRDGGYSLTREPERITVAEILAAVNSEMPFASAPGSLRSAVPFLDELLRDLGSQARRVLDGATLARLAAPRRVPSSPGAVSIEYP